MKQLCRILVIFLFMTGFAYADSREGQWKKVDEAVNKGLPKTAIQLLDPIIKSALAEKKYGEAVKAIGRRVVLEGNIQGNKPEEKITRIEAEIAKAPAEIKPLLTTLQAHWYWHYFQHNRWRFMRRTATKDAPGKDFTTWDLPRLFAEIDKKFTEALSAQEILKQQSIQEFSDVLERGSMPDNYRPTLFDFIANEALEFYTSGEQAAAKSEDAFELSAESPALDPVEKFLSWKIDTTETNNPSYKALRLYQSLLMFHQNDKDKSAFIDGDIARLVYSKNTAFGEEKEGRFKNAMQKIADKYPNHELSSLALYHVATVLQSAEEFLAAQKVAARGKEAYPNSVGGKLCHNLLEQLSSKEVQIYTEHVWNAPQPKISVRYKNIEKIYFRAIAYDWASFMREPYRSPGQIDWNNRRQILKQPVALEWSATLPATPDFKERTQELPAPLGLKPGYYVIVASHDSNFSEKDNEVSMTDVWVSKLALIVRTRAGNIEGFVLDANSGEPLSAATVDAWYLNHQNGKYISIPALTTDTNGLFSIKGGENREYVFRARYEGNAVGTPRQHSVFRREAEREREQTIFFTDRAIYRPGQTIQFKGICLRVNTEKDNYEILKGREVVVLFSDANGKEIAKQTLRCNDFGSFTASFTAPRDRLMGQMQIHSSAPIGATSVRVEEYKRPKFQVTLDAPKIAPKLNDKVSLTGHATAYTGAAIDDALVKYRVVREVRWPEWWYWGWHGRGMGRGRGGSQEIAHGTLKTEVDGNFKIEFVAKPDLSVSEKDEPTFVYRVFADVTDNAGETRSEERAVNVGYTALQVKLSTAEWLEKDGPTQITILTQTLDGEPQSAAGSVKISELKAPDKVHRAPLHEIYSDAGEGSDTNDLSTINNWPLGKVVAQKTFSSGGATGEAISSFKLKAGAYRAVVETKDRFGKKVKGELPLLVVDAGANNFITKVPTFFGTTTNTYQPGDQFSALWGTGYEKGRAYIEVEHRHKIISAFWTKPGRTQDALKLTVSEAMRGGFTVHVTQVRENRAYLVSRKVEVPWTNKDLKIVWEHFTSKLQPNQKETWTAVISPKSQKSRDSKKSGEIEHFVAEMVATLYDKSLDQFVPHHWAHGFDIFRRDGSDAQFAFANVPKGFETVWSNWERNFVGVEITYRHFPYDLTQNFFGYAYPASAPAEMRTFSALAKKKPVGVTAIPGREVEGATLGGVAFDAAMAAPQSTNFAEAPADGTGGRAREPQQPSVDLSKVAARKNLNETAFFFPQLTSDSNGVVRMTFTMPEALTQWRFMAFAHDQKVRSGFIEAETVTAKDLMVQPNAPRFLREGDEVEFSVKVTNQTDSEQRGRVRLTFNDGLTDKSADTLLGNKSTEQSFAIPAKQSKSFAWRIKVPDGLTVLTYKTIGATDKVSDGEEGFVPVLSRRIFVTESLPLPIRGPGEKKFEFKKLIESGKSDSLKHQSLTVQMVSNPSWYAVMALPYLMEFPYECSEQTFNRLYANALARHIANSDPKIHRIFEQWRGTTALDSPMEKNQDLKSVLLEETPWARQAQNESQARKNVGVLFDDNRLNYETEKTLQKLADMQVENGAWPWFPGGLPNEYITLYITTGFGRLRHLGVDINVDPAVRSLNRLDTWIDETYREILRRGHKDDNQLTPTIALYLYGRSFFLKDKPIPAKRKEAVDYFLGQARKYWLQLENRQSQGHLAIALNRFNDPATARAIMASIKERSVTNEEMGMFWRDLELSWWWYRAPIETQALMIEAFDEVMNDAQAVEECKVWLLKQKQTQDWKTTKATADAVYALLLKGENQLASDALVELKLGQETIKPEKVEAGTGFYEQRFSASEVKPSFGEITVKKVDKGGAWGSVHWQYFEDMSKVTPHEGTPLKLKKSLYKKVNTKRGPELQPVLGGLAVGDELVVRIELRTDRDMEYVHMKDQRGSGTEPVNVLSQYKYQDGLAYYESTRDTASHFFIDYLPKGVYVFEYSTRIQLRGDYQTGMAEIQCMYAPEFNSHSESFKISVK